MRTTPAFTEYSKMYQPSSILKEIHSASTDFAKMSLQQIVSTEKYQQLARDLKRTSKVEFHAHLGGAVPLEFIAKYTTNEEYSELVKFIEKLKCGIEYTEGFKVFSMIGKVLNSNRRMEEAAYEFCRSQYIDNVTFTELRTGLKRLDGTFEDYLKAVVAGLERGMRDYPIRVALVLSLRRDTVMQDANEIIDLAISYQGQIVRGIDVSGESIKGNGEGIFDALRRAKNHGLPVTLHIGESPLENPEQQIKELTEIQPERVGHAVYLSKEAKTWIEDHKIIVEACLRSALSVGMIVNPGDHPALELFKKGHPVVFCTDDSTLFGDLTEELALVAYLCDLSVDDIVEMQKQTISCAF